MHEWNIEVIVHIYDQSEALNSRQKKKRGHQLEIAWMYEKGDKALGPESRPKPTSPHVYIYILHGNGNLIYGVELEMSQ